MISAMALGYSYLVKEIPRAMGRKVAIGCPQSAVLPYQIEQRCDWGRPARLGRYGKSVDTLIQQQPIPNSLVNKDCRQEFPRAGSQGICHLAWSSPLRDLR